MTSFSPSLTLDIDTQGVAHVGLRRSELHNAFDAEMIAALTQVFDRLEENGAVRLAVLSGHGRSFCAGGDLHWMRAMKDFTPQQNREDARRLAGMFAAIRRFSRPLIGVAHGVALGGGAGLCAVCDYVLAAADCRFGFTEARIGLVPATISPFVIEKIGVSAARAFFLSGALFSAERACAMGLVHAVVAPEDLEAAKQSVISDFLKAGPEAAALAKQLIGRVTALTAETGDITAAAVTEYTVDVIAGARVSAEGQEGMAALLEGRKPRWGAL